MNTVIFGSRSIVSKQIVFGIIDSCPWAITGIISGMAAGPDSIAWDYAKEKRIRRKAFPADWIAEPTQAGFIRNKEMAEWKHTEAGIMIWDGKSGGSKDMLELMNKSKYPVYEVVLTINFHNLG